MSGPAGWDGLVAWGSGRVLRRMATRPGVDIRLVEVGGRRAVARLSERSEASLDWELAVQARLRGDGVGVPEPIPSNDGRPRVGRLVVVEEVAGELPQSVEEWTAVAATIRRVHRATSGWTQRPGRASVLDLVEVESDDVVDLAALPDDVREVCRRSWSRLAGSSTSVVVGDLRPANVRLTASGPVLLDWSQARVDVTDLDLVGLPESVSPVTGRRRWRAAQAASARSAAANWDVDPAVASAQLEAIDWP